MIKATGSVNGRPALILGLSFGNLDRLRAGDPTQFDGTPYGYPGTIVIFAGRNEATMAAIIRNNNPGVAEHAEKDAP